MQFQSNRPRALALLMALLGTLAMHQQPAAAQLGPVQFDYDLETITGGLSNVGAVHIPGNPGEFWVSRWSSADLFRISESGALIEGPFTVPGVSGIRAMTWDGSLIWAANTTTTLYGIDPNSKTVVDTIDIIVGQPARFVTFDETGNGGEGAFWIGDFNSSLYQVRYDGGTQGFIEDVLLEDIPGRYGCAVDNVSPGGPYFWFFHQSTPPGESGGLAWISQYQHPFLTGYSVSVSAALGGDETDLAGGLFLSADLVPGQFILGGVLQGVSPIGDRLFGFQLGTVANDECETAELIACNSSVVADNTDATTNLSDPGFSCHFNGPGTQGVGTLWYKFEATDTTAHISTCNTTDPVANDSLIAVYAGTCGSLTEIACSEDVCSLLSEVCVFGLTPGQTYYIQLASYDISDLGPYILEVTCPCPGVSCPDDSVAGSGLQIGATFYYSDSFTPSFTLPTVLGYPFTAPTDSIVSELRVWAFMINTLTFEGCDEDPSLLEVALAEDDMGLPGRIVCSYTVSAPVASADEFSFEPVVVPLLQQEACDLDQGWILIQGYGGTPDCALYTAGNDVTGGQFWWDYGSGFVAILDAELAYCLRTQDDLGACCIELEPCIMTDSVNCAALGGTFRGQGTTCASAGCGYTVMQEPFLYASDVALENVWDGADSETILYGLRTAFGNPNNSYQCNDRPYTTFSRLRFEFDQDEKPGPNEALIVEFDLYLDPAGAATNWAGANHWIEFGGHSGDDYGFGSKENEIKFGIMNEADLPNWIDYDGAYFQAHIFSASTQHGYTLNAEPGAPLRTAGWHRLRCEVTPTTIGPSDAWQFDFYIDGTLTRSIPRFGQAGFDWIRLGSGRPTNSHVSYIDNVRVAMTPVVVAAVCLADLANDDNVVDVFDLFVLLGNWGASGPGADLAAPNDIVDVFDLFELLGAWGPCD